MWNPNEDDKSVVSVDEGHIYKWSLDDGYAAEAARPPLPNARVLYRPLCRCTGSWSKRIEAPLAFRQKRRKGRPRGGRWVSPRQPGTLTTSTRRASALAPAPGPRAVHATSPTFLFCPVLSAPQLTSASGDCIYCWDLRTMRDTLRVRRAHVGCVRDIDYNPNNKFHIVTVKIA